MTAEASSTAETIPVTVITGFLGSGKTTLLAKLLAKPGMNRIAVIINEFGEVGLDHLLVATPSEGVTLLSSGCLCCSIRGDLVVTLRDLLLRSSRGEIPDFNRVVVETTGLADPAPVLHTVIADQEMARYFHLDGVVTTIDAVNGAISLDRHFESVKQAVVADLLLLTKSDLIDSAAMEGLDARLDQLNPRAARIVVPHGEIEPERLFGLLPSAADRTNRIAEWFAMGQSAADSGHRDAPAPAGPHETTINTVAFILDRPVRQAGLKLWMDMLGAYRGADLLRVKALLDVEGVPMVVHGVQHVFHPPLALPAWPSPDRRSRIVFITRGLDRAALERTLSAFDFSLASPGLDPRSYARFVETMKNFR